MDTNVAQVQHRIVGHRIPRAAATVRFFKCIGAPGVGIPPNIERCSCCNRSPCSHTLNTAKCVNSLIYREIPVTPAKNSRLAMIEEGLSGNPRSAAKGRLILRDILGPVSLSPGDFGSLWATHNMDLWALVKTPAGTCGRGDRI